MWIISNSWNFTICVLYKRNNCDFVLLMCGNLFSKIIAFVQKVTLEWDFVIFEIVSS